MTLDNTAKLSDIISFLQALEGINQKADLVSVLGSPAVGTDDFATLIGRIQTEKNTFATNLATKGQAAIGTEAFSALVGKVGSIIIGKKWASGSGNVSGGSPWTLTATGLTFTPTIVIIRNTVGSPPYHSYCPSIYGSSWNRGNTVVTTSGTFSVSSSGFVATLGVTGTPLCNWLAIE